MSVDYERVCRLCLTSECDLLPIFPTTSSDDSEPLALASKIKDCVSVQIEENDNLPSNICKKCNDNVYNWEIFKGVCERTQNKLLNLNKKSSSQLEELNVKREPYTDEAYDDGVVIDGSYPEGVDGLNKLQPEGPPILTSLGLTPRSDKKYVDPRMDWQRVHAILDIVQEDEVIDSLQMREECDVVHLSEHDSDSDIELNEDIKHEYLDLKKGYVCRNKGILSKNPKVLSSHNLAKARKVVSLRRKQNVLPHKYYALPKNTWQLFISDDLLELIVSATNAKMESTEPRYFPTKISEIKTLIGILYYHGITRATHQKSSDLWSHEFGAPCVRAGMKYERFKTLLQNLCFENVENETIMELDIMKQIRQVFEIFALNCRTSFPVGNTVVIDEVILPIYGPCPFRYQIKKKELNSGIKMVLVVDPNNFYVTNLDVITDPYFGSDDIAMKMLQHLAGTYKTVVMDSWFTSSTLVAKLLNEYKLFSLAALNKRNELLPPLFVSHHRKNRVLLNGFLDEDVLLMSLIDSDLKTVNILTNEPKHYKKSNVNHITPISLYKKYQSAVEVIDVLMHYYTTMQHTNDWTLSIFFMLLNIASVNAQVMWTSQSPNGSMKRRYFIRELALGLMDAQYGPSHSDLNVSVKKRKLSMGHLSPAYKNRRRCKICHALYKRDRRTKAFCMKCGVFVCREHTIFICTECSGSNDEGVDSDKDDYEEGEEQEEPVDDDDEEELKEQKAFSEIPSMPEVSITVMRPTGETLHARQGIQQLASKDCLVCGRSYRYSHNARRHELGAHNFDRYTNNHMAKKSTMQPKLRPNPFNPKARLMPNPISHKIQYMGVGKQSQKKIMPQKIVACPKPIPIKNAKSNQMNLPYPLRIKALKDLQIKKKEPQILKTLLTSKPEVLVSEPEIMNSGPESPETLISEPEIASFAVETILSEPDGDANQQEEDEDAEEQDKRGHNYDTVDMDSENEIEIARQQANENEKDDEQKEEDCKEDDMNDNDSDKNCAGDKETQNDNKLEAEDEENGEKQSEEPESKDDQDINDEEDDDEELPPIAPVVEINEEFNNSFNNDETNDNDEDYLDDTVDPNDAADIDSTPKILDPDKIYVTKTQRDFILKYRDIIEQINTMTCLCCKREHPRRKAVIQHLQKNGHKVPKHTCYNCVVTFSHIGALLSHMRANCCTNLWKIIYNENGITDDLVLEDEPKDNKVAYKDIFNARSYACKLCPAKFQLKQFIMKHVLDVHEDGQSRVHLACVHCGSRFKDKALWKKHIRNGECTVYIACDLCSETFITMQEFNDHALAVHAGHFDPDNQNKCVDGRPTDCPLCGKKNSSYPNLVKHLKIIHNEEQPHYCQHCDSKFKEAADLNKHIYMEHSDRSMASQSMEADTSAVKEEAEEYHYSCTECNAIFETVDAWTDHQVAEHNQIAHHCDQCEKKFLRPSELAEHKNTHLRVKFYPCTICANSYSTAQKLSEHVQQSHPSTNNSHAGGDNMFYCDVCVRGFKSRQAYSNHMRIHAKVPQTNRKSEQKSFAPQIIGKPILQYPLMQQSFGFKTSPNVPNAPYSCDICGKGFMHKKNIWKHKKVLHADIVNDRIDSEENTMHASTEEDEYNVDENGVMLSTPQFNSFNFTNLPAANHTPQPPQAAPPAPKTPQEMPFSCDLCSKRFPLKTSLWKHKRAKHGIINASTIGTADVQSTSSEGAGSRSSCTICKITFADKKSYYRHRKNVHKSTVQMCKLCGKTLNSTLELYDHLKAAHSRELLGYTATQSTSKQEYTQEEGDYETEQDPTDPNVEYQAQYPCDTCGKQFVGLLALQNHQCINQVQAQPQTFDCEICQKSYTSIAALKSHRGWHLRSPDGKAAANNSGLWMPQTKVTNKVSKFEVLDAAQFAKVSMSTQSTSAAIAKRRLPPEVEVTVVNPNKKMRSDDSLELDQQNSTSATSADDRYCNICDKEFTKRAAYQRHMDEVHQPNSVFCPVCDKSFTRKSTLIVHMKKHYESEDVGASNASVQDDVIHTCNMCEMQFDNEADFVAHREMHEEESVESDDEGSGAVQQPGEFTCGQCGDGVATPRDLIAHRTMHSTPTKFFCNICKVYFARAIDLSTHTRARHADNEKVFFPCAMCERFYMNKKSLQRHIEMSH